MTDSNNAAKRGGVGICGLLGVAFVVLKLCHVINWSWWWVTAPFWVPLVLALMLFTIAGALYGAANLIDPPAKRKF